MTRARDKRASSGHPPSTSVADRFAVAGPVLATALIGFLWVAPAAAQPVGVTAGEHSGFTRIVLQSARGFGWQLVETDRLVRVRIADRPTRLDRDRVFSRIPRTRLADIRSQDGGLVLELACPCPIHAWEERAGVVVLDIRDPDPTVATSDEVATPAAAVRTEDPAPASEHGARHAGRTLAAAWPLPESRSVSVQGAGPAVLAPQADFTEQLARQFAIAMTRGLIDPAVPAIAGGGLLPLGPEIGVTELPPNLRMRSADVPPAAEPEPSPQGVVCPPPTVLAFATQPDPAPFAATLATIHRELYGEFDQPVSDSLRALAEHYLIWGFGAEARVVLDNISSSLEGRDTLVAVADLIEGRQSNARHRLAGLTGCEGPAALFAVLAGAPPPEIVRRADQIVARFQSTAPGLRQALGPALVERLVDAGAIDAARIALESLVRVSQPDHADLQRLAALIDQARGQTDRAARRLDAAAGFRTDALLIRLDIGLERNEDLPESLLEDALAMAETERLQESGRAVMERVILHHARAGRSQTGFALLDRFASWLEPTPSTRDRVDDLRQTLWQSAMDLTETEFLELILMRSDWRNAPLSPETRSGIARRFTELGLHSLALQMNQQAGIDPAASGLPQPPATVAPEADGGGDDDTTAPLIGPAASGALPAPPPRLPEPVAGLSGPIAPAVLPGRDLPRQPDPASPEPVAAARVMPATSDPDPVPLTAVPDDPSRQQGAVPVAGGAAPSGAATGAATGAEPSFQPVPPATTVLDPMRQSVAALANSERLRAALSELDLTRP